jgi:hypothetical protein
MFEKFINQPEQPRIKNLLTTKDKFLELVSVENEDGLDIYAFILANEQEKEKLYNDIEKSGINLEDYGRVIESGYGDRPSNLRIEELILAVEEGDFD